MSQARVVRLQNARAEHEGLALLGLSRGWGGTPGWGGGGGGGAGAGTGVGVGGDRGCFFVAGDDGRRVVEV